MIADDTSFSQLIGKRSRMAAKPAASILVEFRHFFRPAALKKREFGAISP
jgi:hypothetical protein